MIDFLSAALFPTLMLMAGAGDAITMRIPNWLTLLIAAAFFPMALATGLPLTAFGVHMAAGFGLFVVGFALFYFGLFGGGDAKLLAAAGLWLGWPTLIPFLMMTVLAGGLLALAIAAWAFTKINSEIQEGSVFKRFSAMKPDVPYGIAFAAGAILAFPQTWWMQVAN